MTLKTVYLETARLLLHMMIISNKVQYTAPQTEYQSSSCTINTDELEDSCIMPSMFSLKHWTFLLSFIIHTFSSVYTFYAITPNYVFLETCCTSDLYPYSTYHSVIWCQASWALHVCYQEKILWIIIIMRYKEPHLCFVNRWL